MAAVLLRLTTEAGTHSIYRPDAHGLLPPPIPEAIGFIRALVRTVESRRPDALLMYSGGWIGRAIASVAKVLGIPLIFWLRNCSYHDPRFFQPMDAAIVPCDFARQWYRTRLGLDCIAIPSPVIASHVICASRSPQYITFVNPQSQKGMHLVAAILDDLHRRRPDIRFHIVGGRGGTTSLSAAIPDWQTHPGLTFSPLTDDPKSFYGTARVVLVPSLWEETFARVPVEAFLNGIPVIASRRGGLPENRRNAGFLVDVPGRWTSEFGGPATAQEISPWSNLIERLWDDQTFYEKESARARAAAEEFSEERLVPRYMNAIDSILARPAKRLTGSVQNVLNALSRQIRTPAAAWRAG